MTNNSDNLNNNLFSYIEISGIDSFNFLQGQITADLNLLDTNNYILSSYCNIKGRVISVFYVFKKNNNYIILFLGNTANMFLKHIKKYAKFSKVNFSDINFDLKNILDNINNINNINYKEIIDFINYLIINKIPILTEEYAEQFLPANLNLIDLNAISFKKGCYLGQEIIARVYYKGKNKKELCIISNDNNTDNKTIIYFNKNLNKGFSIINI